MESRLVVNLGVQRFDKLREEHKFYVDKTDFIREWWEYGSEVTLITRPRRFGKTLNMSMLTCFFSNRYAGRGDLFEGLSIWEEKVSKQEDSIQDIFRQDVSGQDTSIEVYKYRHLQGMFPVVFLSFAPIKTGKIDEMKTVVKIVIADLYGTFKDIIKSEVFDDNDRSAFAEVNKDMEDAVAYTAVNRLCGFLKRYYHKDVIVILDEYDTPMQEAWLAGTWDETVDFFRNFFNHTFKTNGCLFRGIITGITRVSKESIFSDLNNLDVITTTSGAYADAFGFTQEEVFAALERAGLGSEKEGVKQWYNGFSFGRYTDIYNPWSIASFISKKGEYRAYWANTSGNELVSTLVQRGNADVKQTMESLLQGNCFQTELDEQIVFHNLKGSANAVWSLLLATGYLKVEKLEYIGIRKKAMYTLALTNMEVINMFENMVKGWFREAAEVSYNRFIKALLLNDVEAMNEFINKVALHSFSSFDIANGVSDDDAPERFYHGFVLGLIVELEGRFRITSNRESGFGRYDIMITPFDRKQDCAYIIEFKVHKPRREKNLEETVANALSQIEKKQYETVLTAEGFEPEQIRKYGFAFYGKECLIG
jgi:hypothetical protein